MGGIVDQTEDINKTKVTMKIGDKEIIGTKSYVVNGGSRGFDLFCIQEFIHNAGSDNLSVFSGKFEGGVHCQQVPDEFAQLFGCDRSHRGAATALMHPRYRHQSAIQHAHPSQAAVTDGDVRPFAMVR